MAKPTGDIKIRTLPRPSEKPEKDKPETPKKSPRWIVYVGTGCLLAFTLMVYPQVKRSVYQIRPALPKVAVNVKKIKKAPLSGQTDLASNEVRVDDRVTRHLQDAEIKHEMMMRNREMENLQFKDAANEQALDAVAALPEPQNFGVQLDSENSAERVYQDLHGEPATYSDTLPVDKINARLANRKWMNEMERREKIEFISNFIRSAYDRGYEVQLDQNLVVVGVKKITTTKIVNINQVIDRMAKQGF